ncbi:MAG: hypothetical protein KDA22_07795, partial [Phycisphaerales bacterium]|nr:hypothetical protein [Phycisphaerales bacterium]
MLVLLNDGIRYDGFQCLRIEDIRSMRPDPRAAFFKAALRQRGLRRPRRPRVSLERTADMVATAGRAFPLVTIHREEVDPSCCWIGRVIDVRRGRVSLLELDPMARWESEPTAHRLSELTRLDVG